MSDHNEKYIVFKRDDWDQERAQWKATADFEHPLNEIAQREVHDAVVIRRQDHFAPTALAVYANSISMVAKVLTEQGEFATAKRLQSTADYFHEQAELATEEAHKLPD